MPHLPGGDISDRKPGTEYTVAAYALSAGHTGHSAGQGGKESGDAAHKRRHYIFRDKERTSDLGEDRKQPNSVREQVIRICQAFFEKILHPANPVFTGFFDVVKSFLQKKSKKGVKKFLIRSIK